MNRHCGQRKCRSKGGCRCGCAPCQRSIEQAEERFASEVDADQKQEMYGDDWTFLDDDMGFK